MYVGNNFTVHNHWNNRVHDNRPLSLDTGLDVDFVLVADRSVFRVTLVGFARGAAKLPLVQRFTNHEFSFATSRCFSSH